MERIEALQSNTDIALFFGVHHSVIKRLGKHSITNQTIVRRPVVIKGYEPCGRSITAVVAKWNQRAPSACVTSMVAAAIGKTISLTTLRQRLHINGLYDQ